MMQRPKEKNRWYKGQKKRTDDTQIKRKGPCIICPFPLAFVSSVLFFWPLYHLSFSFDLCIICPFLLAFVSSVLFLEQMIQRPKEKDRWYKGQKKRTDDTKAKRKGQMI
jgi:archaellum biogenesis protein FlaJ (TadC family)